MALLVLSIAARASVSLLVASAQPATNGVARIFPVVGHAAMRVSRQLDRRRLTSGWCLTHQSDSGPARRPGYWIGVAVSSSWTCRFDIKSSDANSKVGFFSGTMTPELHLV